MSSNYCRSYKLAHPAAEFTGDIDRAAGEAVDAGPKVYHAAPVMLLH